MEPIRLGISSCLLGQEVRWDAGHKRDTFLTETIGRWVTWVPVRPEAEAGMGIPREPVRLVLVGGETRMRGVESGEDWTERMWRFGRVRLADLAGLCGYVFKEDSPSCGVFRVRLYTEAQQPGVGAPPPARTGTGLFARAVREAFPLLPVEEEGRLSDPRLREAFLSRVFAFARLKELGWRPAQIQAFHAEHTYQLMAHSPKGHRELEGLLARGKELPPNELRRLYGEGFMKAFAVPATPRRHADVLTHVLGHFQEQLSPEDKAQALGLIEDHRRGLVPLVVPLTLLGHWVRKLGEPWLQKQTYLAPHPRELMLLASRPIDARIS